MVFKLISATEAKPGAIILLEEEEACIVKSIDISKSGKHGAAKCRIEAIGVVDGKKRVLAVPGHERFDVPMIEKDKAQVLSVNNEVANVMNLETFETFDAPIIDELKDQINPEDQVEIWTIDDKLKIVKRKF